MDQQTIGWGMRCMQSGRQLTKIRKIIESWGLEVPKEAAGKRLVAKIHIFAAVFERQLGGLGTKKVELNEERSDKDEESDDHDSFSVRLGVAKREIFEATCYGFTFKNVLPTEGGEYFFEKI